jgi:hypothetical protein
MVRMSADVILIVELLIALAVLAGTLMRDTRGDGFSGCSCVGANGVRFCNRVDCVLRGSAVGSPDELEEFDLLELDLDKRLQRDGGFL